MNQADLERTVVEQQQTIAAMRAREETAARSAAVDTALASMPLVEGAREQLGRLLGNEVAMVPDGRGGSVAIGPGGVGVADYVKSQLASPSFAHFIRGGATAGTAAGAPAPAGAGMPNDGSFSDRMIAMHQQEVAARAGGNNDARTNMSLPFGLTRK
jgi:hypothetical protein